MLADRSYPKVTIITPSFNQAQFIEETILSVLNQTYKNIEYIVVDGGSTDNTMEVVDKYRDSIDIIIHEKDKGQADAINKGFKLATGELAGWINSDDILYPTAVEKAVKEYATHPNVAVVMATQVRWIDKLGKSLGVRNILGRSKSDIVNKHYSIVQQGSFYDREMIKKVGYCNEELHYCMDLDLILRLLDIGSICFLDEVVADFRMYNDSKTGSESKRFLAEIFSTLKRNNLSFFSFNSFYIRKELFKSTIKHAFRIH